MTSKIRVLDDQLINQIAAGEVIEGPASVIKELAENALDAGATEITIEIQGGGRQLIRISDNGCGMNRQDALLCLQRHATSKIRQFDDFQQLSTMGFRGEALPSIASISKFTLLTNDHLESTEGTMVLVDGGEVVKTCSAARARGTTIEVKTLFFNVPVRKKFQKSPASDSAEIVKITTLLALGNPAVKFQLISNQKTILSTNTPAPSSSFEEILQQRISSVLGEDFSNALSPVDVEDKQIKIIGFLGSPSYTRQNRTGQYLFVNQRPIVSPLVSFSIKDGYGTSLSTNRHPVFVLHLFLPSALVDVNVHPQKKEVRFRNESLLRSLIAESSQKALQRMGFDYSIPAPFFNNNSPFESRLAEEPWNPVLDKNLIEEPPTQPLYNFSSEQKRPDSTLEDQKIAPWQFAEPKRQIQEYSPRIAISPQVLTTFHHYIFVDAKTLPDKLCREGLCLIDQRRAHSRILYERLMKQPAMNSAPLEVQNLLVPIIAKFSSEESALLVLHLEQFHAMGVAIHEFGSQTFKIDALPKLFDTQDIHTMILNVLDEIGSFGSSSITSREMEKKIARRISLSKLSQNRILSLYEARALVDQLMQCSFPHQCPDGKPTMTYLSLDKLEAFFKKEEDS